MNTYNKIALNLMGKYILPHLHFFSDLKIDLKRSDMRKTLEEYLALAFFTCIILYVAEVFLISFIFTLLGFTVLFSIFMATTLSIGVSLLIFLSFLNYPRFLISDKSKAIDKSLPFAGIYLSTIASSRLPPHKVFEIFSKFKEYG